MASREPTIPAAEVAILLARETIEAWRATVCFEFIKRDTDHFVEVR